jgi:fatty acid desaturase
LNFLNQDKDESRWRDKNGNTMGYWRYSLEVTLTSYYRAFQVGKIQKKYKKERTDFIIFSLITVFSLILFSYINFFNAIFLFILPMLISLFLTSQATYKHHTGLDTKNVYEASRTDLNPFWNKLTGNLGYHTAHHARPNAHWSTLPELHEKIKHRIPIENIENNFI